MMKIQRHVMHTMSLVATLGGLLEEVAVLGVGVDGQSLVGPQIGGQVQVRALEGNEGGHGCKQQPVKYDNTKYNTMETTNNGTNVRTEVAKGVGLAGGGGVAVLNTSHGEQLLGHSGSDDASSAGSGDQTHKNGAACSGDLDGHGVGLTDLIFKIVYTKLITHKSGRKRPCCPSIHDGWGRQRSWS
jgi:hypothetical protein